MTLINFPVSAIVRTQEDLPKRKKKKKPHVLYNTGANEWYTPPRFIEAAREVMGTIDCDPASCEFANRTVQAGKYFTHEDNGLVQKWHGNVWMNPPYSRTLIPLFCSAFVDKFVAGEFNQGIVLVNATMETEAFRKLVTQA